MKKHLRIVFTAIALTFVSCAFAATETNAQLNQILKRMETRYKKLKTLQAKVTFEKYDSVIRELDVREGRAIYKPQKGMIPLFRVDWTKPVESLSVVNRQYVVYLPTLQQVFMGSIDRKGGGVNSPLAFINMSNAQLKTNYLIKYLGLEKLISGTKVWHLELTPKTVRQYKKADIWVDRSGMPIQIKVLENNNDISKVLLSGIKKNKRLKEAAFKIDIPKNAKIIKN